MPTYEYACTACGHRLEAVQRFTDEPLTNCPDCGGALRKVFGTVGIVLKGSGFYKTDSRAASEPGNGNGKDAKKKDKESIELRVVVARAAVTRRTARRPRPRDAQERRGQQGLEAGRGRRQLSSRQAQSPLSCMSAMARV